MKDDTEEEMVKRVSRAIAEGRLFEGQLLHTQPSADMGDLAHWHLISRIPPTVLTRFEALGRASAVMTTDLIGRDGENAFWIVSYQAERMQHRFVLPLVGATVLSMLNDMRHGRVGLLMHKGVRETFIDARLPISQDMQSGLREKHQAAADAIRVLSEQIQIVAQLLDPAFLKPARGMPRATLISVSSVLPPELLDHAPAGGLFNLA